jgi:hypothetical protein
MKQYLVLSTNHDKLMVNRCTPVVCVNAKNDKEMYALLEVMTSAKPNEFLIFEEVIGNVKTGTNDN